MNLNSVSNPLCVTVESISFKDEPDCYQDISSTTIKQEIESEIQNPSINISDQISVKMEGAEFNNESSCYQDISSTTLTQQPEIQNPNINISDEISVKMEGAEVNNESSCYQDISSTTLTQEPEIQTPSINRQCLRMKIHISAKQNMENECGKRKETATQRKRRLEKARKKYKEKRDNEDSAAKQARLEKMREESIVRRQARRNQAAQHNAVLRAAETPQHHQARLQRKAQNIACVGATVNTDIASCKKGIDTHSNFICQVCIKRCYPNQVFSCRPSQAATKYIPRELSAKGILQVCHRCKSHITSSKRTPPPKAYWNSLEGLYDERESLGYRSVANSLYGINKEEMLQRALYHADGRSSSVDVQLPVVKTSIDDACRPEEEKVFPTEAEANKWLTMKETDFKIRTVFCERCNNIYLSEEDLNIHRNSSDACSQPASLNKEIFNKLFSSKLKSKFYLTQKHESLKTKHLMKYKLHTIFNKPAIDLVTHKKNNAKNREQSRVNITEKTASQVNKRMKGMRQTGAATNQRAAESYICFYCSHRCLSKNRMKIHIKLKHFGTDGGVSYLLND